MIVIEIVLYLLLFLLSILLLILVLPIFYASSGQNTDAVCLKIKVFGPLKWFYVSYEMQGLEKMERQLKLFGFNVNIEGEKTKRKKHKDKKAKEKRKKGKRREKGFLQKILRIVQDFWNHVKPGYLRVEGRYGFEDPYGTALACALINSIASHGKKYDISLTPVFDEEVMEGRFIIEGRIILVTILWIYAKVFIIPKLKNKIPFARKYRVS